MIGNTGFATTIAFKRQAHAEYKQGRNRVGSARIGAPIVRFCACKVAWMNCPHRGIMWVIEDHLRPSGHIVPDHAGDRGAVSTVLAPHDHLHINPDRAFARP
jgi:hypothetical protein